VSTVGIIVFADSWRYYYAEDGSCIDAGPDDEVWWQDRIGKLLAYLSTLVPDDGAD